MDGINRNDDKTDDCDSEENPHGHGDDIGRLLERGISKVPVWRNPFRHVSINGVGSTKRFR